MGFAITTLEAIKPVKVVGLVFGPGPVTYRIGYGPDTYRIGFGPGPVVGWAHVYRVGSCVYRVGFGPVPVVGWVVPKGVTDELV